MRLARFLSELKHLVWRRHWREVHFAYGTWEAADLAWLAQALLRRVSGPVAIKALGHRDFVPASRGAGLIEGDSLKTGPGGVAARVRRRRALARHRRLDLRPGRRRRQPDR